MEAIKSLRNDLRKKGSTLIMRKIETYNAEDVVDSMMHLLRDLNFGGDVNMFMNTRYEPKARSIDKYIVEYLQMKGIEVHTYNANLLYDPQDVSLTMTGNKWTGHWGTLMPFVNTCRKIGSPLKPLGNPDNLNLPEEFKKSIENLNEEPLVDANFKIWADKIKESWIITEEKAEISMYKFLQEGGLANYETERSRVDKEDSVSRLSPYLRHGLLSPRTLYWAIEEAAYTKEQKKTFGRRLFWRDLAYFQLSTFPEMASKSIRTHYDFQQWAEPEQSYVYAWQRGQTGYPMVDAAMRELYATGWMHQSMRMVVASFLVEFMGTDWRYGFQWFHDTLVDADVAINSMMWQNAGRSGIDQWNFVNKPDEGSSRDPNGSYVRKWVPELRRLPTKHICRPFLAPADILHAAGVVLGSSYPLPIVTDLNQARRLTTSWTIECRRKFQDYNDSYGYDFIDLPDSTRVKIFTKKEFRIDKQGKCLFSSLMNSDNLSSVENSNDNSNNFTTSNKPPRSGDSRKKRYRKSK